MTPANRAELRGGSEREGRKGARAPRGRARRREKERENEKGKEEGERDASERARRERRILRVPRGEVLGLACPGMASSHSSVFTVRGHPRARATFGFSTSLAESCRRRRINRIINDRSRLTERERERERKIRTPQFHGGSNSRRSTLMNFRTEGRATYEIS